MDQTAQQPDAKPDKRLDRRKRLVTMRLSTVEGCFALITLGLQAAFFIPFLNELGATDLQVGLGASLPALVIGIVQLFSARLMRLIPSNRLFCSITGVIHGLLFIPLAFTKAIFPGEPVWGAIFFLCLVSTQMGLQMPVWGELMSHVVPRRKRGTYFAKRNRMLTFVQLVTSLLAGYMLDRSAGNTIVMFTAIWLISAFARVVSGFMLSAHHEPETIKTTVRKRYGLRVFISELGRTNFGNYVLAFAFFNFSVHMAVPFFPVHMINNLGFSYTQYTVLLMLPAFVTIFMLGVWGRISDRIGYVVPLRLCATIIAALPLAWVLTENFYLLVVNQFCAGIAWAGFNLIAFNYSISALDSGRRMEYLSYLNVMNFCFLFAGATLGGFLLPKMIVLKDYQVQSIFLLSTLLRTLDLTLFHRLRDVERYGGPVGAFQKLFFDPRLSLRTTVGRFVNGMMRRPF